MSVSSASVVVVVAAEVVVAAAVVAASAVAVRRWMRRRWRRRCTGVEEEEEEEGGTIPTTTSSIIRSWIVCTWDTLGGTCPSTTSVPQWGTPQGHPLPPLRLTGLCVVVLVVLGVQEAVVVVEEEGVATALTATDWRRIEPRRT